MSHQPLAMSHKPLAVGLWPLVALALIAPPVRSQSLEGTTPLTYRIDVRPAAGTDDKLGIDFDFRYDRTRDPRNPQGNHYGLGVGVSGFQSFDRDVPDVNSVVGEVTLQGRYYHSALRPLSPEKQARFRDLAERDEAGGGPGLTAKEQAEYDGLFDLLKKNRQFFTYDLHYRFESSQDWDDNQHAFGAGGGAEVPALHRLLDVIPALTRKGDSFKPQPVRIYLGADRVTGAGETVAGVAAGEGSFWRLRGSVAWATSVFDNLVLRARGQGYLILDPPAGLKAQDLDRTGFLEVWLTYPVAGQASLLIKYLVGRLPPDYDEVNVGKVGLSVTLE
jgi:hypothetical protein